MLIKAPARRAAGLALVLALGAGCAVAALAPLALPDRAEAQVAFKGAPGPAPTHNANFSGIWMAAGGRSGLRVGQPYNTEWAAKYKTIQDRVAKGQKIHDGTSECLLPGMPRFLLFTYPVEILQTPGQVTMLAEFFNETRRVFTDGRGHPKDDELEETFRGHSIGHWEGDTLVIHTMGLRGDTVFSNEGAPHSDKMTITERLRLTDPNTLQWDAVIEDPIAFTRPWEVKTKMVRAPADTEIREYVCAESKFDEIYEPG